MAVINTNVNAIIARNAGAVNERSMTNAMQQLSTGKRINVAADDAAGLAISTKMTSQIRGLDQAVRNANDGIAMLQVVEGATVEMTNMLQRMRELAVQSANDTNTSAERSYLNDEYQQLLSEINRIAQTTQWNGQNVMDGTGGVGSGHTSGDGVGPSDSQNLGGLDVKYQVGANASQTIDFNVVNFTTSTASSTSVTTATFGAIADATAVTYLEYDDGTNQTYTALSDAPASDTATEWSDFVSAVETTIQSISGYENVTVAAGAGLTLTITDEGGRDLSDTFDFGTYAASTWASKTSAVAETESGASTATTVGLFGTTKMTAVDSDAIALGSTLIDTQGNSDTAITTVDAALTAINEQRSAIGATINRLTYAADNLTNISANVNAARSRVLDTDYAQATTELARTQIIQQASTAMLAQANQGAQSVLSLLK